MAQRGRQAERSTASGRARLEHPLIANFVIETIELMQPKLVTVQRTMVNPEYLQSLVYNTIKNIDLVHGVKSDAFP